MNNLNARSTASFNLLERRDVSDFVARYMQMPGVCGSIVCGSVLVGVAPDVRTAGIPGTIGRGGEGFRLALGLHPARRERTAISKGVSWGDDTGYGLPA